MATWPVAFGAAVAGATAGAAGSILGGRWAAQRERIKDARRRLLAEVLPRLVPTNADAYHAGSFRGTLAGVLNELRAVSALAGRRVEARAARLDDAWRQAVLRQPPDFDPMEEEVRSLVPAEVDAVADAHADLSQYLLRLMAPWWSRLLPSVKWPEDVRKS